MPLSYDNLKCTHSKRLINDSIIYITFPGIEVRKYNYSDTLITSIRTTTNSADPQSPHVIIDTGFIGSMGDVFGTLTLLDSAELYIDTFAYDDKPNPFYTLNIRSTYNPIPGFDFYLEDFYLQKNNITSSVEFFVLGPDNINESLTTYSYTYYPSGFPSSVDIAYDFGQEDDYRLSFVYKKL